MLHVPAALRPYYDAELAAAAVARRARDRATEWRHLEGAHILGQCWVLAHTAVHLRMLGYGVRYGTSREVLGQVPRVVFGCLGSLAGRVPTGNTGGLMYRPNCQCLFRPICRRCWI